MSEQEKRPTPHPVQDPVQDPVAESAAKDAIGVTDTPRKKHPWIRGAMIAVIALIVVIGTFGAVTGVLNSVQLKEQNDTLKQEQQCQTVLLDTITKEQKARAAIGADDRAAALLLARENVVAKTQAQKEAAYSKYLKQLAANDKRRQNFPVPTFNDSACKVTKAEAQKLGVIPSSTPVLRSPTSIPSSSQSNSNGSATSTSVPNQSSRSVTVSSAPKPQSQRTVTQQQPGTTSTKPITKTPNAVPTTPGVLNLPGCNITILVKVC